VRGGLFHPINRMGALFSLVLAHFTRRKRTLLHRKMPLAPLPAIARVTTALLAANAGEMQPAAHGGAGLACCPSRQAEPCWRPILFRRRRISRLAPAHCSAPASFGEIRVCYARPIALIASLPRNHCRRGAS